MTASNRTTLKALFETGDTLSQASFEDLIDSFVNLVETGQQTMAGALSTTQLITSRLSAGDANVTGTLSANTAILNSVRVATVSASAVNTNDLTLGITTLSALGSTQGTAALLSQTITRIAGIADGQTTGVRLPPASSNIGRIFYIHNSTAVSGNIWPDTGCAINGLSVNAAFALAANTLTVAIPITTSSYAVR